MLLAPKTTLKRSSNSCSAICRQNSDNFPIHVFPVFDTGAHASFVNREVAEWIGQQARPATRLGAKKRGRHGDSNTSVSLAGTSLSSPILGSVTFELTFLNEVRQHDTIKNIQAQVIDSCIESSAGPLYEEITLYRKSLFTSTRSQARSPT